MTREERDTRRKKAVLKQAGHPLQDLPSDLSSLLADPDWTLAHFTLAADLTTLREECRFARSQKAIVARYDSLPFAALSFLAESPSEIAGLAARLVGSDEAFYLLLNEKQAALAEEAFSVEQVSPEWQMLFAGELKHSGSCNVVPLKTEDLEQMRELAEETGLMALEESPLRYGPAFGVWDHESLVAMGCTHLQIPFAAEIGNIATRKTHRHRGLAREAVRGICSNRTTWIANAALQHLKKWGNSTITSPLTFPSARHRISLPQHFPPALFCLPRHQEFSCFSSLRSCLDLFWGSCRQGHLGLGVGMSGVTRRAFVSSVPRSGILVAMLSLTLRPLAMVVCSPSFSACQRREYPGSAYGL